MKKTNKPIIEAIINTVALAATAAGTTLILSKDWYGFALITFGLGIEWFKYWGRRTYW